MAGARQHEESPMSTLTRVIRNEKPGFRAKRLGVNDGVVVTSKTIGTTISYNLSTENLSRTGMLLHLGRNRRVPYLINTILELTVDAGSEVFERPVSCLGKIVRVDTTDPGQPRYGVHIVQIDGRDLDVWEKGVVEMETRVGDAVQKPAELPSAG